MHIDENDSLKVCCYSNPVKKYSKDFNFSTDEKFNKIRKQMLVGDKVEYCTNCYEMEKNGGESFRIRDTNYWVEKLDIQDYKNTNVNLQYYDIRNDNLCNLSCRICYPGASSQIEKEHRSIGWHVKENTRQSLMSEIINYDTVTKVYIAGGEPTLMPEFKKFLKQAINKNRTDIELQIVSNGTNLNDEYCDLIGHFSNVNVTISIDGFDRVNRYIRWPNDWTRLVKNINNLYTITNNISFNITVSIWNVTRLKELVDFLDDEFNVPVILMNPAMPIPVNNKTINISPFNFPDKKFALSELKKLQLTKSYKQEEYFRDRVNYFINGLNTANTNMEELQLFFTYNDALDLKRNVQLDDYIPELAQYRTTI